MRNPERIEKVMRELTKLWKKHPDWRLGQLIFNIPGRDPFFIEDCDLITLGYEKFGNGDKPDIDDFPEYYIEPNAWNDCLPRKVKGDPCFPHGDDEPVC